jgi:hypothetical protein
MLYFVQLQSFIQKYDNLWPVRKRKMTCQKHKLCYILCNCKVSSKNMIICGLYEKDK